MARPAPAVERTIRLLKYLARNPSERFTLSALSRDLEMNKATVHSMLATLVTEGVLIRHPGDKTYTLGPELVGLGNAAVMNASSALEVCLPEVASIARDLDVSCVVTAMIGIDIVSLARRDVDRPIPNYRPVGYRFHVVPPRGREFIAWAPKTKVLEWMTRIPGGLDVVTEESMFELLDATRHLGYVVNTPEVSDLQQLLASLTELAGARKFRPTLEKLMAGIERDIVVTAGSGPSALATSVISPVFGPDGLALLGIAITGFSPGTGSKEVKRFTQRLSEGTLAMTEAIHGHEGIPDWAQERADRLGADLR